MKISKKQIIGLIGDKNDYLILLLKQKNAEIINFEEKDGYYDLKLQIDKDANAKYYTYKIYHHTKKTELLNIDIISPPLIS